VADALDGATDELVALALEETALGEPRLTGEVGRTTGQLRMFADGLEEGSFLDVIIDTADPAAKPVPRPDLRRLKTALGPVLVFAASNFPFAFSVAGGDTASALAAGCPVVLKAHPGHPRTSQRTAELVTQALADAGLPAGAFALIQGFDAGVDALRDPRVAAGSFTGSVTGGRALWDVATSRDVPIPFFAEMGSLNPVFVTPGAVAARGREIAEGYVGSYTLGVGQFCTKPGLLFLPKGHGLTEALVEAVAGAAPARMLLDRIHTGHREMRETLAGRPGIEVLVDGELGAGEGATAAASLLRTDVASLVADRENILEECFGPTSIIVEYDDARDALRGAEAFSGNLTGTIHAEEGEEEVTRPLLRALTDRVGRLVWNAWPTGVAVCWAMHHGGPYPATTTPEHTSVGMTAIRRFLRPVTYQSVPQELLPEALRDENSLGVPRRINGSVTTDDVA
jgi:NADP-dependent aldehyde dehydrogenase